MKFKLSSLAALVATLAIASSANAALTIYQPWETAYTANGLSGVLFNVVDGSYTSNGNTKTATVAMGAHAYKNGVYLPNNGVDTYYATTGLFEANRANWSFDFAWNLTSCNGCSVWLGIDKDASSVVDLAWLSLTNPNTGANIAGVSNPESWNMEMSFIPTVAYDFNPYGQSSTGFRLEVRDASSNVVAGSSITVEVPEPGSLALAGLALTGLALVRRRRSK